MTTPQGGIFALGTSSHAYLEFDLREGASEQALASALAGLREPRTTMGGVNLVMGFRPTLWRTLQPRATPPDLEDFDRDVVGPDGFTIPATQHDAVVWLSGSAYDVIFDMSLSVIRELGPVASVADETASWPYHRDLDLTGFIDGTENPTLIDAADMVLIPDGSTGAGGTVLLLQKWRHDAATWNSLPVERREHVIGRRLADSTELEDKPDDSHVARTDQDVFGKIFRRNTPYGTVLDHGTMFVGFAAEQRPLSTMLQSMAGVTNGTRDSLTRYTTPLTGAYYFVPSARDLRIDGADED